MKKIVAIRVCENDAANLAKAAEMDQRTVTGLVRKAALGYATQIIGSRK
jgi:uncharacterized protein (DUF1778 family)